MIERIAATVLLHLCLLVALAVGPVLVPDARAAVSQSPSLPVSPPGIRNFGRVTPMPYRGGDFIPNGVQDMVHLGVKTVISLRSHSRHGEPDSCAAHGIAYYPFPMTTAARPRPAAMDSILDIIRSAKAPDRSADDEHRPLGLPGARA